MILKSLTIQGFKSFAGRVTLELPRGVAAVVGPNGSGKSNISDAIRWVLGEQSMRLLRGTRLEDVIFSGSETKRPVGMAEVSVTFDNQDGTIPLEFSEVTVTRRVYRSGESEFFINKTPCRLRDIQELFMDTGIGKGSLAIVGQGEVDSILSARPEDRRAFLEEAAGISKYRARKREALARLAGTEESLVRVRDIIAEVESRLHPLRAQAEAAKTYEELNRELRAVEVTLLLGERAKLLEAYNQVRRDQRRREEERDKLRGQAQEVEEELRRLGEAAQALDEEIDSGRDALESARAGEAAARHREELAADRLARAGVEEEAARRRLGEWQERLSTLEAERARGAQLLGELRAAAEERRARALEMEALLGALEEEIAKGEAELERARRNERSLAGTYLELTSKRARLEQEVEGRAQRAEELREALARLEEEEKRAREELAAAEEALRRAQAARGEAARRAAECEERSKRARLERDRLEEQLVRERRTEQELRARRQVIAGMEASREGYHRGVRAVLSEAPRRGWDLKGAVAEVVRVPRELETAIEVALGGAQQYVIAQRDQDAKAAIEFLKERGLGRATFLPLESLRPTPLPEEALRRVRESPDILGVASSLIEAPAPCRPAIEYLLGRVVIAKSLDAAIALARREQRIARIVTLDGDVVVPGGTMTGGSRPARAEGLVGRSRQLEELDAAIEECRTRAAAAEGAIARLEGEIARLRGEAGAAEEERRRSELEFLAAESRVKECRSRLERVEREAEARKSTLARAEGESGGRAGELERLAGEIEAAQRERERLAREIETLEASLRTRRAELEGLRRRAGEAKVALAEAERDLAGCERELLRLAEESERAARQAEEESAALARLDEERRRAQADLERARVDALKAAEAQGELAGRLEELRERRRELRERIEALDSEGRRLQARVEEVQEACAALRVQAERLEGQLMQVEERLRERAGPAEPEALELSPSERDPEELRSRARELRRRIEALGPVNLASIDEYREVSERYAFLTSQKSDLEAAKAQLEDVIARIDRESRSKLEEVFREVNAAFAKTFARLFGGGKASLEFTDPSDPLESGVEIFVQPPGKKLQNLLALSGGERALAAIALLFAILTVRPSPFCVLDEIDAALDDHNLDRFRSMLEEFSQKTQFLVITHRQLTMEAADSLFGVTMEEPGASSLVSLRMSAAETA